MQFLHHSQDLSWQRKFGLGIGRPLPVEHFPSIIARSHSKSEDEKSQEAYSIRGHVQSKNCLPLSQDAGSKRWEGCLSEYNVLWKLSWKFATRVPAVDYDSRWRKAPYQTQRLQLGSEVGTNRPHQWRYVTIGSAEDHFRCQDDAHLE